MRKSRRNPAVFASPDVARQCFVAIALALEAETLQGATAQRAAAAAKQLAQNAGMQLNQILSTINPETQQAIASFFA